MKTLKGSETEKNLYKTFAGECRARTKYNLFSEKAKEEGYMWVSEIFNITAENEYAHAREAYKRYLECIKDTEENLMAAAIGETEEFKDIYKGYEETARKEGFKEIAHFFKELREVEEEHQKRFLKLNEKVKNGKMFESKKSTKWICLNCGYIHEGEEAPEKCPLCKYPQSFFKEDSCTKESVKEK